jgi:hypothetical protein
MSGKFDGLQEKALVDADDETIYLGSIPLDVFQIPEQPYRLSKKEILEIIGQHKNWLSRLPNHAPEALKALQSKGFTGYLVKVKVKLERGSTRADTLSIPDAMRIWGYFARHGNTIAVDILEACGVEAIERRADKAFGVKRTEEEYNQRFAVRMDLRKNKFQAFAKEIAVWERRRGIYRTCEGKRWFQDAHDQINLRLQDLKSRQIKRANNLPDWALIRDHFEAPVLVDYSSISQLSANFLRMGARDPVEAVNLACDCYLPDSYVAMPVTVVENIQKVGQRLAKMKKQAS